MADLLDELAEDRGVPSAIRVDGGPEFISKAVGLWAYANGVTSDFSRPGEPTGHAQVESFSGSFRDECLNANWFFSFDDAREKIEAGGSSRTSSGRTTLKQTRRRRARSGSL